MLKLPLNYILIILLDISGRGKEADLPNNNIESPLLYIYIVIVALFLIVIGGFWINDYYLAHKKRINKILGETIPGLIILSLMLLVGKCGEGIKEYLSNEDPSPKNTDSILKDYDGASSESIAANDINGRMDFEIIDINEYNNNNYSHTTSSINGQDYINNQNTQITFNSYRLSDGFISVPSFLSYQGESDDDGPMFYDESGQIKLYAMCCSDQELELYHEWTTNEIGNGKPTYDLSKYNYFVQSGYNYDGEIYYTKAYVDYGTYPPILYTATIIFPVSKKIFVEKYIPLIFNKFPNIKK